MQTFQPFIFHKCSNCSFTFNSIVQPYLQQQQGLVLTQAAETQHMFCFPFSLDCFLAKAETGNKTGEMHYHCKMNLQNISSNCFQERITSHVPFAKISSFSRYRCQAVSRPLPNGCEGVFFSYSGSPAMQRLNNALALNRMM